MTFRSEKLLKPEGSGPQSETISKGIDTMKAILNRNRSSVEDYKHKQGRIGSSSVASLDKVRCKDSLFILLACMEAF